MADFESHLTRWQSAGLLDAETVGRIRAHEAEQKKPAGLRWQVIVVLILGAILLAGGVALFVSAHWDQISPVSRLAIVMAMVSVFHLGGAFTRKSFHGLSTALHAVGTLSTGAAIALVGQIFNIQEHWPAAILMWAIAALFGWILLHDEAQQTLTLLLFPAWMLSEFTYYADGHIGEGVFISRFLVVWAVLYLTFFIGSKRKVLRGILFAVSAIASLVGVCLLLDGWRSWGELTYLPLGLRAWGWVDFAVIPLLFALFQFRKSMLPVVTAILFSVALPWCQRIWTESYNYGSNGHASYVRNDPNLAAHALVAAFCVFIIWWGVRQVSKALVNLGIVAFAITVIWFYFSDIFDKLDRSLGLIGLGILFLAGGWVLEKTRRNLVGGMKTADVSTNQSKEAAL
ncbi:MAG: DUF2157 domain-containing protein [Terracidiphilus sp.]|jgi:uncharacterized membrane protein